jgi:RNA polymerase sigma-70 factor (ECF subfamily)
MEVMATKKQEARRDEELSTAYQDYAKSLRRYAFSKIASRDACEDLVQDTFMKAWMYLTKGGKVDMMKAFLYHILNNLIVDEYRRKKNKATSLEVLYEKGYEPSDDPSGRLFNFLDGKAAMLSIRRLPKKYQRVMRMRYVKGLSLKEMSLISQESKNTVSVQTHRGLIKLRRLQHVS